MALIHPTRDEFLARSTQGNLIPVYREILADMETPVSAFRKACESPHSFLLESVEGGESLGRYSFLGAEPLALFQSRKDEVEIQFANGRKESFRDPQPLDRLRDLMQQFQFVADPTLPPFCGGAVGYISYDTIAQFEPVPQTNVDDREMPDLYFIITDSLLIFDHVRHRMKIVVNAHLDGRATVEEAYDEALRKINGIHQRLLRIPPRSEQTVSTIPPRMSSNLSQEEYVELVAQAKEYIKAGDVFQVVLSQRLHVGISAQPFDIYRALRAINPSPYMFFLRNKHQYLVGSSPEILVKVTDGKVQLRPIAGTRPRGQTPEEDHELEQQLRNDPKECAEHVMLVDLGRNDVGRVCEYGSVEVDDFMTVEKYSHVMHLVSNVTGRLRSGLDCFDVFKASFPAGTVSGAPKIRAMQIINELEPTARGPYAGAVGYFGFTGNLDTCITLRTVIIKDEDAYVQAGAGIVADSDPVSEFRETLNKASAMLRAIEMAERGMD